MKLLIDSRSLLESQLTGVGHYTESLLREIIQQAPNWEIQLFTSGNSVDLSGVKKLLSRSNVSHLHYPVANKWLAAQNVLGLTDKSLHRLSSQADYLFLPNINHWPYKGATPLVLTIHDLSFLHNKRYFGLKGRWWHASIKFNNLLRRAKKIITVSDATKDELLYFFPAAKSKDIRTIYEGVDLEPLTPEQLSLVANQLNLPQNFILYVGTMEPRKNVPALISAFNLVRKTNPDLKLVLVGKYGWSSPWLPAQTTTSKDILWLQYLSDFQKQALYQLALLFVWPSFYEGFGLPPLEAAIHGTTIITSYRTSLPEILQASAYYVNPYNYGELAQVMSAALKSSQPKQRLNTLTSQFSWKRAAAETIEFIQN